MNGYMIAPTDLTERQLLIYYCLYKKCDFKNMQVSYATTQIINDVKIIDLSVKIVNAEIKTMINKGYIKLIRRGAKGNGSVYEIVKNREIQGNLSASYREVKGNLKHSNTNDLDNKEATNKQVIGNSKANTNKEKEKENINNIILKLNELASTNYKATTKKTISLINARIKEGYTVEEFYKVIEYKVNEWSNTEFEKYLRPDTLFGNKFEWYLNQANKKSPAVTGAKNNTYTSSICNSSKKHSSFGEIL